MLQTSNGAREVCDDKRVVVCYLVLLLLILENWIIFREDGLLFMIYNLSGPRARHPCHAAVQPVGGEQEGDVRHVLASPHHCIPHFESVFTKNENLIEFINSLHFLQILVSRGPVRGGQRRAPDEGRLRGRHQAQPHLLLTRRPHRDRRARLRSRGEWLRLKPWK